MSGPADRGGDGSSDGGRARGRAAVASVVLDPRMRERRAQVEQEHTRRRRKRWLFLLVPVVLIVAAIGLAFSPVLGVRRVEVAGTQESSDTEVLEAAGLRTGRPMVTLDGGAVARRVEALPWVRSVTVDRQWPGTVRLEVTEREPAAVALADDSNFVAWVDEEGRVLRVGGQLPEGFVAVSGLDTAPEEGDHLPDEALDALNVATRAQELVPGILSEVSVELEGVVADGAPGAGATVVFGQVEDLDERLVALDSVLGGWDVTCLATVNLTVSNRPVVTDHPDCGGNG